MKRATRLQTQIGIALAVRGVVLGAMFLGILVVLGYGLSLMLSELRDWFQAIGWIPYTP
jgi:hypothetical protein